MNTQMEDMGMARCVGSSEELPCPLQLATLPTSPPLHQHRSPPTPTLGMFIGTSGLHHVGMISH